MVMMSDGQGGVLARCQSGKMSDWHDVRLGRCQGVRTARIGKIWQWEDVRLAIC